MESSGVVKGGGNDSRKVVAYLSNFEVLEYFKEKREESRRNARVAQKLKTNTHLHTITYEALQYLSGTPAALQNSEAVRQFMSLIAPFGLTKAEKLIILNNRPTSPVDIQAIVEESEERLTEEQIDMILNIVETTLPSPNPPNDEGQPEPSS